MRTSKQQQAAVHLLIRDGEMSKRGQGLTIMSDVFRKTVKISDIMSEISYRPIFD
jgi:hypothetical protein